MALPNATWSGSQIVTYVARKFGLASPADTVSRAAVLDDVNVALWEISLQSAWDWNLLQVNDQAVVAGTSDYNLPTGAGQIYDQIYDARLVGNYERTLFPTDERSWDRYAQGKQNSVSSVPTHYHVQGAQQAGIIRLLPTPSISDTLRLRVIVRQATIADSTASSLAIADKYIPVVLWKACENVATWKTPERVGYFATKANRAIARAIDIDRVGPDENPVLSPQIEHGRAKIDQSNLTDLDVYPRGW